MSITNQFNRTKMQQFAHNLKLILVGILVASSVLIGLMYHMSEKARDMERNQYQKELNALKASQEGQK